MKYYKTLSEIPIANFFLGLLKTGNLAYLRKDIEFSDIDEQTEIPENADQIFTEIYSEVPNVNLTIKLLEYSIQKTYFKYLVTNNLRYKNDYEYNKKVLSDLLEKENKDTETSDIHKVIAAMEAHFKFNIDIFRTPARKIFDYQEIIEREVAENEKLKIK